MYVCVCVFVCPPPQVAKTLCGFPSFFAAPLFRRIRTLCDPRYRGRPEVDTDGTITLGTFCEYWEREMAPRDHVDRCAAVCVCVWFCARVCARVCAHVRAHHCSTPHCVFAGVQFLCPTVALCAPAPVRFFSLVSQPGSARIVPTDFMPFVEELLAFHPGLAFLESTPEFQVM